jgi:hypothetical protein
MTPVHFGRSPFSLPAFWLLAVILSTQLDASRASAQSRRARTAQPQAIGWAQPQLNVLPARGLRGEVTLANAADGLTLPIGNNGPTYSSRSALRLSVQSDWPGLYGYRPILVTVRSEQPATSDRTLQFRFTGGDWNLGSSGVNARQAFTLPQGQSKAVLQLLVPQYQDWQRCAWDLYVDGVREDDLTVTWVDMNSVRNTRVNNATDVAAIGISLDQAELASASADVGLAYGNPSAFIENLEPEDLPTDWLGYTSINVVVLPTDELEAFVESHPQQAAALLRWVATGGNLWLTDAGSKWQRLAGAEQILAARQSGTDAAYALPPATASNDLPPQWRFAPLDLRATDPVEGAVVLAGFPVDPSAAFTRRTTTNPTDPPPSLESGTMAVASAAVAAASSLDPSRPKTSAAWFAVRGWGLGTVTAFRRTLHGTNELSNQEATRVVSQSLLAPRQQWGGRFGSVPHDSNVDFNDWLIPGVGMAPVGSFQILITLFVLAIGPLTYWLLRRMGKLPLLVAIVPAAAILTTLALFAYGVLIDGVAAQVRGRSVTLLDQRSGDCASWGRYSYYAGIAPRAGLVVPTDQAMFPILPNWSPVFGFGGRRTMTERQIVWDDRQRLTRGWLASRTPTQYHALSARQSTKRLQLRPAPRGMRVVNQLGVELVGAAIQDHDGKFYWCDALPVDKGVVLPPVEQAETASKVRRLFTENLPELPPGDDGRRRNNSYYNYAVSDSLMEGRLGAINSPQLSGWGPGRYIAFTSEAIELSPGIDDADEQKSFHVIEGSW